MTMSLADREAAVNRFFTPVPLKPSYTNEILLLSLGGAAVIVTILLMGIGATQSGGGLAGGLCCSIPFLIGGAVAGIAGLAKYSAKAGEYKRRLSLAVPKPPAEWIISLVTMEVNRISARAMAELRLVPEDLELETDWDREQRQYALAHGLPAPQEGSRQPMMLLGPAAPTSIVLVTGGMTELLFSRCRVTAICPTSWQFGIYECELDLATGRLSRERARNYPYTQVSAVTTRTYAIAWQPGTPAPVSNANVENVELANAAFEFKDLEVLVAGGERATIALGLVDQRTSKEYKNVTMLSANSVIDQVKANLRRRDGESRHPQS
ncbi:hypothetical protein [Hamadaea tsunoensis]|uniref:hypothetical protein n=1 Tax=Hamadaea tsunoensis TaxID=53368 RepID=UPI0004103228|nr:hypothetical protein [Hamadaea tsunoensis]